MHNVIQTSLGKASHVQIALQVNNRASMEDEHVSPSSYSSFRVSQLNLSLVRDCWVKLRKVSANESNGPVSTRLARGAKRGRKRGRKFGSKSSLSEGNVYTKVYKTGAVNRRRTREERQNKEATLEENKKIKGARKPSMEDVKVEVKRRKKENVCEKEAKVGANEQGERVGGDSSEEQRQDVQGEQKRQGQNVEVSDGRKSRQTPESSRKPMREPPPLIPLHGASAKRRPARAKRTARISDPGLISTPCCSTADQQHHRLHSDGSSPSPCPSSSPPSITEGAIMEGTLMTTKVTKSSDCNQDYVGLNSLMDHQVNGQCEGMDKGDTNAAVSKDSDALSVFNEPPMNEGATSQQTNSLSSSVNQQSEPQKSEPAVEKSRAQAQVSDQESVSSASSSDEASHDECRSEGTTTDMKERVEMIECAICKEIVEGDLDALEQHVLLKHYPGGAKLKPCDGCGSLFRNSYFRR